MISVVFVVVVLVVFIAVVVFVVFVVVLVVFMAVVVFVEVVSFEKYCVSLAVFEGISTNTISSTQGPKSIVEYLKLYYGEKHRIFCDCVAWKTDDAVLVLLEIFESSLMTNCPFIFAMMEQLTIFLGVSMVNVNW